MTRDDVSVRGVTWRKAVHPDANAELKGESNAFEFDEKHYLK